MDSGRLFSAPKSEEAADFRGEKKQSDKKSIDLKLVRVLRALLWVLNSFVFFVCWESFCCGCELHFLTIDFKVIQ